MSKSLETNMMKLSIVIVSWNAKKYLMECLQSLTNEIGNYNAEIIVVDNGSSDGSPELVKEMYPKVYLIINKENLGFAKANNIGIKHSKGQYVFLINSDVYVQNGCISKMVDYMDSHHKVGVLGPRVIYPSGEKQITFMQFPTLWNTFCDALALYRFFPKVRIFSGQRMRYLSTSNIHKVEIIIGCFMMIRKDAINDVGLLDENFFIYGEDVDWCRRFGDAGWELVYYPDAIAIHYGGASSSNAPIEFYLQMQKANLQLWKKYRNCFGVKVYIIISLIQHLLRVAGNIVIYLLRSSGKDQVLLKVKRSAKSISFFGKQLIHWR